MWFILQFAYTTVFILLVPVILLRLYLRSFKLPAYRQRITERLGISPPKTTKPILWIHAVSVGETLSAIPLAKVLLEQYPNYDVLFTTMTPTASAQLIKHLGTTVRHTYIPYDIPFIWKHYLKHLTIARLILIETEIWPNLLDYAAKNHIPVTIANAKLSKRSLARYLKVPYKIRSRLFAPVDSIGTQSQKDADRFIKLGLTENLIQNTGNLKYELNIPPQVLSAGATLKQQWGPNRFIWLAASTHEGEEAIMLEAHKTILKENPTALLIVVPRHPERFSRVHQLIKKENLSVERRSITMTNPEQAQVILVDTMGELQQCYVACDVAVVCGSLVKVGGHNALEPAALGKAILMGPHTYNCQAVVDMLKEEKALKTVHTAHEISLALSEHIAGARASVQMGHRAQEALKRNTGTLDRLLKQLAPLRMNQG